MIRIGYQGVKYSYNYFAAKNFAKKLDELSYELVPLTNSMNVVTELRRGGIDYGVMAIRNSIAGIVPESYKAMKTESFEQVYTSLEKINHCVFIHKDADKKDITAVASHEMALKQCGNYIASNFPKAEIVPEEDTAVAAKNLQEGALDKNTAVICHKEAGKQYGLTLIDSGIQDVKTNTTEFRLYRVRHVKDRLNIWNRLLIYFYSDEKPEIVFKVFISAIIFGLFYLNKVFNNSETSVGIAWFYGGLFTTLFFLIISNKVLRSKFYASFITGYWTYDNVSIITDQDVDPNSDTSADVDLDYGTPRLVKIYQNRGKVKMKIYKANRPKKEFAYAYKLLHSPLSKREGDLIYLYRRADKPTEKKDFHGVVYMDWKKEKKWRKMTEINANFVGETTGDQGSVHYYRISKEEFKRMKNSDYLAQNE